MSPSANHAIVLFDGICNLCNASVNFIIDHDPAGYFQFASQQSPAGEKLLRKNGLQDQRLLTLVLIDNGHVSTKSRAAIQIARRLWGWPRLAVVAAVIPPFARDALYDFVARNRYRWFGRLDACRLPTPQTRERFLE